ncbi:MAG: hypothetical protein H7Y30_01695 [Pyrinomonadaceae bacterium]|nr:hypothetical protein [Pyrinomonadaceae bacterium]
MEERHKIIIETGTDPDETLSRPFFNTQATRDARPVVPLAEAGTAAPATGKRRWTMLALLAGLAIMTGVAAGLGISIYQSRQQPAEAAVAVRPAIRRTPAEMSWTYLPEEEEEMASDSESDMPEPATEAAEPQVVSSNPPPVSAPTSAPAPPSRNNVDDSEERKAAAREERREERRERAEQRREERRAADDDQRRQNRGRNRRGSDDDLPQDPIMRRTRDELYRIREIFEGTP